MKNGVRDGVEIGQGIITEQSVKEKMTSSDLMLVEIMRTIDSGELIVRLQHGVPQIIMVANRN